MKKQNLSSTDTIYVGGGSSDSKATLCIYTDNLDPSTLREKIGYLPTRTRLKGEKDTDKPSIPPARTGLWLLDAPKDLSFIQKITFLLEATESDPNVWREIAQSHDIQLRCAIFLHSWTESFSLPREILKELAERGWEFSLSMYSAEGDEIVDAFLTESGEETAQR